MLNLVELAQRTSSQVSRKLEKVVCKKGSGTVLERSLDGDLEHGVTLKG